MTRPDANPADSFGALDRHARELLVETPAITTEDLLADLLYANPGLIPSNELRTYVSQLRIEFLAERAVEARRNRRLAALVALGTLAVIGMKYPYHAAGLAVGVLFLAAKFAGYRRYR